VAMMYGDMDGWGWMMLMPLVWIALVGVIAWGVVMIVRRPVERPAEPMRRESAREILDRRYASGEIDADAYTLARDRLAEHRPKPS